MTPPDKDPVCGTDESPGQRTGNCLSHLWTDAHLLILQTICKQLKHEVHSHRAQTYSSNGRNRESLSVEILQSEKQIYERQRGHQQPARSAGRLMGHVSVVCNEDGW